MAGLGAVIIQQESHQHLGVGANYHHVPEAGEFAQRFLADSTKAGEARVLTEQMKRAQTLYAAQDWDGALGCFGEAAEAAVELKDQQAEARAVLGLADCLAKPKNVDAEFVVGMYRHVCSLAEKLEDDETHFRALAGIAMLNRSLRRWEMAVSAWEHALNLVQERDYSELTSYASTQLGLLLIEKDQVDVVNDSKEAVELPMSEDSTIGPRVSSLTAAKRALKLLTQVVERLPESTSPAQAAVAHMNLAAALHRVSGKSNKRKEEDNIIKALELLWRVGGNQEFELSVESQLVQLYDEDPWLADGNVEKLARADKCRAKQVGRQERIQGVIGEGRVLESPEERHMREKAQWAQEKLATLAAQSINSDSDCDENGYVHPPGSDWRR
eukprot:TRINITY_DN66210_c0_g1_i1.p1 TRINITY_DN66210_c0_g1~~TRINITY_DN66210_c0_g1_i1.p1  ORF type:complete len:385 (-),score=81.93 TRINITY_DN66210_c0_g1_i1:99-1253(-)